MVRDTVRSFVDEGVPAAHRQHFGRPARSRWSSSRASAELGVFGATLTGLRLRRPEQRRVRPRSARSSSAATRACARSPRCRASLVHVPDLRVRQRGAEAALAARAGARARRSAASASPSPTSARTRAACSRAREETASTGCSTARRCGSPTARIARRRGRVGADSTDGVRGFLVETRHAGLLGARHEGKFSLRASVTSRARPAGRARARGDAMLPERDGPQGPALVPDAGALRHRVGRDRRGDGLLRRGAPLREGAHRSSTARSRASSSCRRSSPTCSPRSPRRSCSRWRLGRLKDAGKVEPVAGLDGQAQQRAASRSRSRARAATCSARTASPTSTTPAATW